VRPYLGSHGGDVELLGVEEGVVRLRLLGSCDGCPSSSVTLKLAVETAIESAAPEVSSIEVEETSGDPGSLISVDALRSRLDDTAAQDGGAWSAVPELGEVPAGDVAGFSVAGVPVLACRIGSDLFAFRDRCAHCTSSLAGATLERRMGSPTGHGVLRCPTCRTHYDVRRAGAAVEVEGEHLEPFPVLVRDGVPEIAVPADTDRAVPS
ncbi:MAG: NifU family protein, partial [Nocardioidaceae bacterium]